MTTLDRVSTIQKEVKDLQSLQNYVDVFGSDGRGDERGWTHDDPVATFQLATELAEADGILDAMQEGLDDIREDITILDKQNNGPRKSHTAKVPTSSRIDPELLQTKLQLLQACKTIRTYLDTSMDFLTHKCWKEAADSYVQARETLQETQEKLQTTPVSPLLASTFDMVQSLQVALDRQKKELILETGAVCTITDTQWSATNSTVLLQVWEMVNPSVLSTRLQGLVQELHRHILQPLFSGTMIDSFTAADGDLQWKWATPEQHQNINTEHQWKTTFHFLTALLEFLVDTVLGERVDWCRIVGVELFGTGDGTSTKNLFVQPLLNLLEASFVPKELGPSRLGELATTAQALQEMMDPLLVTVADKFPTLSSAALTSFPSSIETLYFENRRYIHLNAGTTMILEKKDFLETQAVGEVLAHDYPLLADTFDPKAPAFPLHRMHVSNTSQNILTLCRSILQEAVQIKDVTNTTKATAILFQTARSVLHRYRALIPPLHPASSVPHVAAILHNDCAYIAHCCLTLGLEYKQGLERPLLFVDLTPSFLLLAEQTWSRMLTLQSDQIATLVSERIPLLGPSLRSNEALAEWSDAEAAVEASVYHVRHLHHTWGPVVATPLLHTAIGHLIDTMLQLLLDPILQSTEMSAEATQFLYRLMHRALHDVAPLLPGNPTANWEKFQAVAKFMDMTLLDIQTGLSNRTFVSMTGAELSRLVVACFDDSAKRRNVLRLLASHKK